MASQERIQQGPPPERRFGEGPNLAAQRGPDCAKDDGTVGGNTKDGVSQQIQRRTAEQIVDLPAPVFTERISARIKGLSAVVEAAKTSSQDQNLQRTVAQVTEVFLDEAISPIMEKIKEVRERTLETFCEQTEVIDVVESSSQDWKLLRTVDQDSVEVVKNFPQERISGRSQVIEVLGKCRGRQKYPSGANF